MSDRLKGTLLLVAGILTVGGVSTGSLPAETFWLGLILYPIGGYLFLKGNRKAHDRMEQQVQRSLRPIIRSQSAKALADQQAARPGGGHAPALQQRTNAPAPVSPLDEIVLDELEIGDGQLEADPGAADGSADPDFKVSQDVSFPVDIQERTKIADELRKLVSLFQDGALDESEFQAAKAKLLK